MMDGVAATLSMPSTFEHHASRFAVQPAWRLVLKDLGIDEADVLRAASLPLDLFVREEPRLEPGEYFRLWRALDAEVSDPLLPLRIGRALTVEGLDPPLFAALASPDLDTALARLARFKRLVGPMALELERGPTSVRAALRCHGIAEPMPPVLAAFELVFLVTLARLGTREDVRPLCVSSPDTLSPPEAYAELFGVAVERGRELAVTFSAVDLARPFLTVNDLVWQLFRPELELRLADLETDTVHGVRRALLELLPAGRASIDDVAGALGIAPRTLQRMLRREGARYSEVLSHTRERLALHYLRSSSLSGGEIASLLGYDDPNSFIRAFSRWTGRTPERARRELSASS